MLSQESLITLYICNKKPFLLLDCNNVGGNTRVMKEYCLLLLDGDYGDLMDDAGEIIRVARAFLPMEAMEGDRILCDNLTYSLIV